ncbi:DUF2249 domain-containing protein [Schaalia sp. 19OD2882]|uniref:DUF2249 domain-containing protein n=1 Tax=Schaalia sp. 19OD2882 TaxID=2794089 RepID=UPI001C1EB413|nr:DUF2249 domain-containing protein [Schaalia sp. 19OD2882]QWW19516.1 DUF2249 domain-containing protein [Schaalia sp. 19OD2882]
MTDTNPEAVASGERRVFRLVDSRVADQPSRGGGCGCGGHGHGRSAAAGDSGEASPEPAVHAPSTGGGCGCGGKGRRHGHGNGHGAGAHVSPGGQGPDVQAADDELVVTSIPKVVRHAALFAALDAIPVGENLVLRAPHRPDPVFAHLQESEAHYRVETLEDGPRDWRHRITRLS